MSWGFWLGDFELPVSLGGASSKMAWALVPPIPNELTAARRGVPLPLHSVSFVLTKNGLFSKSILGLGLLKWRLAGIFPWCNVNTVLIKPVTPAAVSRCPMLVLAEPMAQYFFLSVWYARRNASISTGSPRIVPVP